METTKENIEKKQRFKLLIDAKSDGDGGVEVDLQMEGKADSKFIIMTFVSSLLQEPEIGSFVLQAFQTILKKESEDFLEDEKNGDNKRGITTVSKLHSKN